MMTKAQAEKSIAEQLRSIWKTYKDYVPEGKYLNLCIVDGIIMFYDSVDDQHIHYVDEL